MNFKYMQNIKNIINEIELNEKINMENAVKILVNAIENKNSIFCFGASHAGILTEELFYRAGGLMVINPIFAESLMLNIEPITHTSQMERLDGYGKVLINKYNIKEDDIVIIHSVSGRNPVSIDVAVEAKRRKAKVIVITNLKYSKNVKSRHKLGKNLYHYSDILIDNHGDIGDACVKIENIEQKVGASSTITASFIMNSIIVEVVQELVNKNMIAPVFYSANIDGGDELNREVFNHYKEIIHYNF